MKRRDFVRSGTSLGVLALTPRAATASMSDHVFQSSSGPWPIRGTEAFDIESKAVGDTMAVGVWQPTPTWLAFAGRDPKTPIERVVYVLDGSFALGVASTICMLQLADLIKPGFPALMLVGVDYPVGRPNARTRDYTMEGAVPQAVVASAKTPESTPGGAAKFLRFLEDELDPLIRSRYPVKGATAGILGDSYGGTFSFYAFLRQSRLFDRYWLGSPGLFTTNTDHAAGMKQILAGNLIHDTRMFLSLGELEANGGRDFYEDMGRNFNRLVSELQRTRNRRLTWRSKIYPDHTHISVFAPALNDALLFLFGP